MTLLLVQKELDDGVILLLFFTDLKVEHMKECCEIALDICIELVQFMLHVALTAQLCNCWHIKSVTADADVIQSPTVCIICTC